MRIIHSDPADRPGRRADDGSATHWPIEGGSYPQTRHFDSMASSVRTSRRFDDRPNPRAAAWVSIGQAPMTARKSRSVTNRSVSDLSHALTTSWHSLCNIATPQTHACYRWDQQHQCFRFGMAAFALPPDPLPAGWPKWDFQIVKSPESIAPLLLPSAAKLPALPMESRQVSLTLTAYCSGAIHIASRALMTLSCDRRCARYRRAIPLLPSARDILMRTPSTGIWRVGSRSFGEQIISATPYQKAGIQSSYGCSKR